MKSNQDETLLLAEDIVVEFEKKGSNEKFKALDGVTLEIKQGETVGLVGESGSGKTTLGRAILKIQPIKSGRIFFKGKDISNYSEREIRPIRRYMQMIFQDPGSSFNPRQTLGEALRIALLVHKLHHSSGVREHIYELLERVGLSSSFYERLPHEVSGGQLQRVAIARVLALQPSLIIADEAVSKLDVSVRSGVLNLLKDLQYQEDLSMIFVTHDLAVARYLSHKLAVLYHGHIFEQGDAGEIFENPLHPYTYTLLGKDLDTSKQAASPALQLQELPSTGCRYSNFCPLAIEKCSVERPLLSRYRDFHQVACWRAGEL